MKKSLIIKNLIEKLNLEILKIKNLEILKIPKNYLIIIISL